MAVKFEVTKVARAEIQWGPTDSGDGWRVRAAGTRNWYSLDLFDLPRLHRGASKDEIKQRVRGWADFRCVPLHAEARICLL